MSKKFYFNEKEIDRIISMSWEDRTPFESIEYQFGLNHNQLEKFLKIYLKIILLRMCLKHLTLTLF